jgi:G:T-mismatch repair DNA endonuclease (very short patch repair protein)
MRGRPFRKGHVGYKPQLGKHFSEEHKEKLSYAHKGKIHSGSFKKGHIVPEAVIEALVEFTKSIRGRRMNRERRLHMIFPKQDTKPERIAQDALNDLGIPFVTHKPILGQPDIFIEPSTAIFIDGDYWHNRPEQKERDKRVTEALISEGYSVYRIWEHELVNRFE